MPKNPSKILPLVSKHEKLRSSGINLIASENWLSPEVRNALSSDLAGRYHSSWYGGTKYAQRILEETAGLACKVFGARYAIVTALSGNLCDLAAMFAFTRENESVAMVPKSAGGYPLGTEKFGRARLDLPLVPDTVDVDAKAAARFVAKRKPALTILGGCTAMDVVSILKKKQQDVKSVEVAVRGTKSQEPPTYFTDIELEYIVRGNVDEDALRRAIELSQEKYCSVGLTVKKGAGFSVKYRIEP